MQLYEIKTSLKGKNGKHKKIFAIGPSTAGLMKESGYNGFTILNVNTNVPTMFMSEIARRLQISIEETINFFRGLNGKPNLGMGLFEGRFTQNPESNLVPEKHAEKFIRRVMKYQKKHATA